MFCFCGIQEGTDYYPIESLESGLSVSWKVVGVNEEITRTFSLSSVCFLGRMVVFGGSVAASYNMFIFSEEGKLEQDLSEDPLIPGVMSWGSVVVKDRKVWTVVWNKLDIH